MTDTLSPEQRSRRMALVRGRDTNPELVVRRALHAAGLRYRLHASDLPGKPDVVFPSRKIAVFVHGCFWHRHADPACKLARTPKSRLDFWEPKLAGNAARDKDKQAQLRAAGWTVIVFWECGLKDSALIQGLIDQVRDTATSARRSRRSANDLHAKAGRRRTLPEAVRLKGTKKAPRPRSIVSDRPHNPQHGL